MYVKFTKIKKVFIILLSKIIANLKNHVATEKLSKDMDIWTEELMILLWTEARLTVKYKIYLKQWNKQSYQ